MRAYTRVLLIAGAILAVTAIWYQSRSRQRGPLLSTAVYPPGCHKDTRSPIDDLIRKAPETWLSLMRRETSTVEDGAAAYRSRRGRHPPPGFDAWYHYAQSSEAIIIEDFFDQIYRDIEPFWGLEPRSIRASVAGYAHILTVRSGRVKDVPNEFFRTEMWVNMLSRIANHLPDMDIALNRLDEARVIAPRSVVDEALKLAETQRLAMMQLPNSAFSSDLAIMSSGSNSNVTRSTTRWITNKDHLHLAMRDSCPSGSALALHATPWASQVSPVLGKTGSKFVEDTTIAKDICTFPEMTTQHGALVEPATVDFTTSLLPIFTGSKLPIYNDIVIPEPAYYSDDQKWTGKTSLGDWSTYYAWETKIHGLVWRGGSTGGKAYDHDWRSFHRHRLVSRLNASETDPDVAGQRPADEDFKSWLISATDVAFTRLFCGHAMTAEQCPSMGSHYSLAKPMKMATQYQWKYLPDTDGNSVSERFRAFLLSNSAPIKSTIFDDWHDHRLLAWYHYIPMQISYVDLYDLMAYFLGYDKTCAHDEEGERIAHNGRQWSEKVLRKDDMVIYLHRALLEYARVVHDNRERLGYVNDLL